MPDSTALLHSSPTSIPCDLPILSSYLPVPPPTSGSSAHVSEGDEKVNHSPERKFNSLEERFNVLVARYNKLGEKFTELQNNDQT